MNTLKAFLPGLRRQELGADGTRATIAGFGSVDSWTSGPSWSVYAMTKGSVFAMMDSLAIEFLPFNIKAISVKPGYFSTGFLGRYICTSSKERIPAYEDPSTPSGQSRLGLAAMHGNQPGDAPKEANVIVDILSRSGVAEGKETSPCIVLGPDCEETIRQKCSSTIAVLNE